MVEFTELPRGSRPVEAKFDGTCPFCKEPIRKGQMIVARPVNKPWVHDNCTMRYTDRQERMVQRYIEMLSDRGWEQSGIAWLWVHDPSKSSTHWTTGDDLVLQFHVQVGDSARSFSTCNPHDAVDIWEALRHEDDDFEAYRKMLLERTKP